MLMNLSRSPWFIRLKTVLTLVFSVIILCSFPIAANAHHPMGGTTPNNFGAGFLSGLGHPIIGIDHFAFIVASGLAAINLSHFWLIPGSFVVASAVGILVHLRSVDVPNSEIAIAISVILLGSCLIIRSRWRDGSTAPFALLGLSLLAGLAGIFHGYAYGETVIGAETTPIVAYLTGLAFMQGMIAWGSYYLGGILCQQFSAINVFKYGGILIAGVGLFSLLSHLALT